MSELEQYWTYLSGHLLISAKAERIHGLLQMMTSPGKKGPSLADVNVFLQAKVQEGLLVSSGGAYRLPKSA